MSRQHHRKQRFKLRSFYIWHRYLGISAALLLLVASVTGILLNHTEELNLDSSFVRSDWLLDWYGVQAPDNLLTYPVGDRFITLMGPHLYLNRKEMEGNYHNLVGAIKSGELLVVAVSESILLLTPRGERVEKLGSEDGVPGGMQRIGIDSEGKPVIQGSHDLYQPDGNFIRWQRVNPGADDVVWSEAVKLAPKLKRALQQHYRGEVLPIERVVLDMHSGRFLGKAGPWLMDAAAVALILLALSGSWMWLKRRR